MNDRSKAMIMAACVLIEEAIKAEKPDKSRQSKEDVGYLRKAMSFLVIAIGDPES